jgi:enterochelin esterase-like enzyme
MRALAGRMSVLLTALAILIAGLVGAYNYWESYFEHRGFTPVHLIRGAHPSHRLWVHFYSAALGRQADYLVYLPPGYDPRLRYPVYYLLHGSPGRPQVYAGIAGLPTRMDNLLSRHRLRPMILVFPDGRIGASTYSDSEWANTPSGNYESYVIEVVHDVDRRFSTIARRGSRVIAGFSAGAYGATNLTLHHPGVFGNLQSWSGYFRQRREGVFSGASPAVVAANSPLDYASRLRGRLRRDPLRAFLFVGRDDNDSVQQKPMALALARAGAEVSYALYKGGHDWQLWHAHLNQLLILASRDVNAPLRVGRGAARTLTPGVVPLPFGIGRHHHAGPGLAVPAGPHHRHRRPRGILRLHVPRLQLVAWHERRGHRRNLGLGTLLGGLILALVSAALINLGFLLQHRGLRTPASGGLGRTLRSALGNRTWLAGQVVGWIGFGAQIISVAIAPLALVQAFAAGGLALSVPLAARLFHHPVSRAQRLVVLLMALALAVLPFGYGATHDRFHGPLLAISLAAVAVIAAATSAVPRAGARAIGAGAFYGVADAAIKAVSVRLGLHGADAAISIWTLVVAAGTFAGFLAFQTALRDGGAVSAISVMTGLTALVALVVGLTAFGESLGTDAIAVAGHLLAITIVLGCVPYLAAAQTEIAGGDPPTEQVSGCRTAPAEYGPAG